MGILEEGPWRTTWRPDGAQVPLGLSTALRVGHGQPGLAEFPAGTYPACSVHGAMNRVSRAQMWRCLECNIGIEYP
jgi:hypothetical protein